MRTRTRSIVWFAAAPILALALACGGGDDKDDSETSTKSFSSSSQSYTISYPSNWQTKPDFKSGNVTADLFVAPDEFNGQAPNITVYCDKTGAGLALDKFVDGNVNGLKQNKVTPALQNKVPVGSTQGQMMTYSLTSSGVTGEFAQVLMPDKRCGWIFTLTSPVGHRDDYVSTLLQMAASFKAN